MAGTGRAPKVERRNKADVPQRGEWKAPPGIGWQHGPIPKCPDGLLTASREAWNVRMRAWWASHWTPDDLPILRQIVRLFDKVERNDANSAEMTQYRQLLDSYGITPKGQQDRRWSAPKEESEAAEPEAEDGPYGHLRAV